MADTKRRFYEAFRKPVPGFYNNIIQELLVQQHLMRYNRKYRYDEVRLGGERAERGRAARRCVHICVPVPAASARCRDRGLLAVEDALP